MVSKARLRVIFALAVLVAGTALLCDAVSHQLWGNLALGVILMAGCLLFLVRLEPPVLPDPPVATFQDGAPITPFATLADQVPIPLLEFRTAKGFVAINRAARALFHADDLVSDPPEDLVEAVGRGEPGTPRPLRLYGRTYAIGISEVAMSAETIWLVSLTDIQSEIRMAEATALRDLLRVLSHEIMNSLTPVASLARIARKYLDDETPEGTQAAREALDVLAQRASGLARFVEAYRSMARLPEPILRPSAIGSLLGDIVRVFEQSIAAKDLEIELDLPGDCPILEIDETLITQALLNVLTNAAEATEEGPKPGRIRVSLTYDRDEIRVAVADNGVGVAENLAEQIFHAFVTTKPNGTGTGLNLARQIALAHGGDLIFMGGSKAWSATFCLILRVSPGVLGAH